MTVTQLIVSLARRYNLDPQAVLAVARGEGGVGYGAVGDQGTSFGPFQLHIGGALPRGKGAAWANSPAGLEYAIRKMAESGAVGLTGPAAIQAIISRFERPANIAASVQAALGRYGSPVTTLPPVSTNKTGTYTGHSQRVQATQRAIQTLLNMFDSTASLPLPERPRQPELPFLPPARLVPEPTPLVPFPRFS